MDNCEARMGAALFIELCRLAAEDFKRAAIAGKQEGVALLVNDGHNTILTGYGDVAQEPNPAARALKPLTDTIPPGTVRDDLPREFEIAAIVIATALDINKNTPKPPSQETLNALGEYVGTEDGQLVSVISAHWPHEMMTLKL